MTLCMRKKGFCRNSGFAVPQILYLQMKAHYQESPGRAAVVGNGSMKLLNHLHVMTVSFPIVSTPGHPFF